MCAVSDPINSYKYLNKVTFTLEGSEEKFCFLKDLFESVSLKVVKLSDENKVKYHLASVMASNLVTALLKRHLNFLYSADLHKMRPAPLYPLYFRKRRQYSKRWYCKSSYGASAES